MFRVRKVADDVLPANRSAIEEVKAIFRQRFPGAPTEDVDKLGERLRDPFDRRFRTSLFVAEKGRKRLSGFAIVLDEPTLRFAYLDYIATEKATVGRGVGAALYEHVRDDAVTLGCQGLFLEVLPEEPGQCREELLAENASRLRFYERYGARPIVGTAYRTPVPGGSSDCLPYLVFDDLDRGAGPSRDFARGAVRAILERKYGYLCPPEYVERVVTSFAEDPIRLRPPRYTKKIPAHPRAGPHAPPIAMTVNDRHEIHHIRERGYVESPVRIPRIERELARTDIFERLPPKEYPLDPILAVHDRDLVDYLQRACAETPPGRSVYPYVFPVRNAARKPVELSVLAGYYCIDTFTPIHRNAFLAAKRAVDCTLTLADEILAGRRFAYALVRPPGHHAESHVFGGFCYFNNAAVAAQRMVEHGKVAILDVDYHHGNGQQEIFYSRPDVLTVSIHGDPSFAYPYFTGFADERGAGEGEGFNLNLPQPETLDGAGYRQALSTALDGIRAFGPKYLVVSLGLDPAQGDPTGTWSLRGSDFEANGRMIASLGLPTLVVQEGGYRTRTLGVNARRFFEGMYHAPHAMVAPAGDAARASGDESLKS